MLLIAAVADFTMQFSHCVNLHRSNVLS